MNDKEIDTDEAVRMILKDLSDKSDSTLSWFVWLLFVFLACLQFSSCMHRVRITELEQKVRMLEVRQ